MKKTLYKKTVNGLIQEWTIETKGDSYRTIVGKKDGKLITNKWVKCYPKNVGKKNATTAEEQAEKEALALYTKKLESGYTQDVNNIEKAAIFKPMLAKLIEDYRDKLTFPIYIQPKLDGIRCIATKDGLFSRNGKRFVSIPHVYIMLRSVFEKHPDAILDGELYNHQYNNNFNKIVSIVRKDKPTPEDIEIAKANIQYHIYDLASSDKVYSERKKDLDEVLKDVEGPIIINVETHLVNKDKDIDKWYERFIDKGYEGAIVREDQPYQHKRTKYLLKVKDFQDTEYEIVGFEEGIGNRKGTIGKFILKLDKDKTFKSNVKGDFEYLRLLWKHRKQYIGKMATVKYFRLTPDGIPRFPYIIKFRDYE